MGKDKRLMSMYTNLNADVHKLKNNLYSDTEAQHWLPVATVRDTAAHLFDVTLRLVRLLYCNNDFNVF